MKRLLVLLMIFVFLFSIAASAANVDIKDQRMDRQLRKMAIIEKLEAKGNFRMDWNNEKDAPRFISGNLSDKPVANADAAARYMETNKALFNLENGKFQVKNVNKDAMGMTHYRMQYAVDGIAVYGGEMILHADKDGNVKVINGLVDTNIPVKTYSKQIKLSAENAIKAAEGILGFTPNSGTYTAKPKAETVLYQANNIWQPVYLVTLQFVNPYPANMKIFVNAENGTVVDKYNSVNDTAATGTGIGVLGATKTLNLDFTDGKYYMRDLSKGAKVLTYTANNGSTLPGTLVNDIDNVFDAEVHKAAVDAHYYTGNVYDYYKNNFGRNSFDGNGANMISTVHYGTNYNNAFWNGSQMTYGDGDGINYRAFTAAADVIAHEFTHAVTEYTCNLVYQDQPGALNESISDVFGYLIEGEVTDWLMGEDCIISGDPFRSMSNPTAYGQPDHMNNYYNTVSDNGGVHTNSGIPNKAFYIAATQINDNAKMGQIWYRAMTNYLTTNAQFVDAKNAFTQAATDLYGSAIAQIISDAHTQVGIVTAADSYEPNNTTAEAYAITSGTTYNALIASSTDNDYYKFTTNTTGNISITLTNLPKDYDIYLLNSAGTQVAKSEAGSTNNENISYNATTAGTFYIKVFGYNGTYSTAQTYALKATYPTGTNTGQWFYETKTYDSPHNYTNNYNGTNTYSKPGATKVTVHFSKFATEKGYDFVYIKDKNGNTISRYDGTVSAFWATVDGDTMNINLVTDYSITAYGYTIDQVGYFANGQLVIQKVAENTAQAGPAPSDAAPIDLGESVVMK